MLFPVKYSISDLEMLSGINAPTIRVWERRYKLLTPKRTDTNIRYYDNEDLKYLLSVASLQREGHKISQIALMKPEKVFEIVSKIEESDDDLENILSQITKTLVSVDTFNFRQIVVKAINKIGLHQSIESIIVPILDKIGVLWQTGVINPAQEHFATNIVRDIIITHTFGLEQKRHKSPKEKVVLFLPDNELHEIGLLLYKYLLINEGYCVVYLGQAVPIESLVRINEALDAPIFVTSITNLLSQSDIEYSIQRMSKLVGEKKVLITGRAVQDLGINLPSNIYRFGGYKDILSVLYKAKNG